MPDRRVRVIRVAIEKRPRGLAVATSVDLPDLNLVTTNDRLDSDIPQAIQSVFECRWGLKVEVLPV